MSSLSSCVTVLLSQSLDHGTPSWWYPRDDSSWDEDDQSSELSVPVFHPSTPIDEVDLMDVDLSPVRGRPGMRVRNGIFLPRSANERRRLEFNHPSFTEEEAAVDDIPVPVEHL